MKNLIFLDTETTGLGEQDRLLQIAYHLAGDVVGDTPIIIGNFKPPVPISFEAMATHHITEKMVADFPSLAEAPFSWKIFLQEFLNLRIMVAHNALFDKTMLEREQMTVSKYICTKKVAQYLFDEPSYKMQYLRYRFGLEVKGEAHSADGDVAVLEVLFDFLFAQMTKLHAEDTVIEKMLEITQTPTLLRRITFGKHKGTPFEEVPKDYLSWLKNDRTKNPSIQTDPDLDYTLEYYLK